MKEHLRNPYLPPTASLQDEIEPLFVQGTLIPRGNAWPAWRGVRWCITAWRLFAVQPGGWLLMLLMYVGVSVLPWLLVLFLQDALPMVVPLFMQIVLLLLLTGGVVLASENLGRYGTLDLRLLFSGPWRCRGKQLGFGVRYAGRVLLLLFGFAVFMLLFGRFFFPRAALVDPSVVLTTPLGLLLCLALFTAGAVYSCQAFLFGQALVMLHGLSPGDALFCARSGSWRNIKPGLTAVFLVIAPAIFLGTLIFYEASDLLAYLASMSPLLAGVAKLLSACLVALISIPILALVFTSAHVAYREIFLEAEKVRN
ncbi:hypothetical protein Q9Q94_01140 [Uliginosibacterium sp. 31-16]|uniref:hypothetical protein n=1 Tax=Uliginosibacterium sp. 31-16 TaxID=3068315 RepID=UPI0027400EB3|nr:hypothetical protein [Uliginosibacterium sp. 31-16]MDP5238112.1 hypothetical protein [Uliginosibacterium sp. 31-16]